MLVCACIGVCAPSHEGVVRRSRPGHVADGPARHPAEGGVEAEREGQGHSQSPDTHDHHLGGSGRQARLQGMDDGHVPVFTGFRRQRIRDQHWGSALAGFLVISPEIFSQNNSERIAELTLTCARVSVKVSFISIVVSLSGASILTHHPGSCGNPNMNYL